MEFLDGSMGYKSLKIDEQELINVRSTFVSSFSNQFEIETLGLQIKKEDVDFDLFLTKKPELSFKTILEMQSKKQVNNTVSNPFQQINLKNVESIWPEIHKSGKVIENFQIPISNEKKQMNAQFKPEIPKVNFVEFKASNNKHEIFENAFKIKRNSINSSIFESNSQSNKKEGELSFSILEPYITEDPLFSDFLENSPKIKQRAQNKIEEFADEFRSNFSSNPFDENSDKKLNNNWVSFKEMKSDSISERISFEQRKNLQIFENLPQNNSMFNNPFDVVNNKSNKNNEFLPNSIFDETNESFKDAVLFQKNNSRSFATNFKDHSQQLSLEKLLNEKFKDDFDLELEKNKKENEKKSLGNYDIDPEEKMEQIVEGVQGWIQKTGKFFGKVELNKKEENKNYWPTEYKRKGFANR